MSKYIDIKVCRFKWFDEREMYDWIIDNVGRDTAVNWDYCKDKDIVLHFKADDKALAMAFKMTFAGD